MKLSLLNQLIEKETKEFGDNVHPISTNVKLHLIPVAETLLNRIAAYMPEYTLHNIAHCEKILDNIRAIIPENIELNIIELTILIYSVYLHDIGMVINKEDAEKIKQTDDFKRMFIEFDKDTSEDEILTEYIRRNHVRNSLNYIDEFNENFKVYKIDFSYKGVDLSQWVKNVILSHAHPIDFINKTPDYPTDKLIHSYKVDIQFLSMLLRLGDILDFDIFRTPPFLYNHINPQNKVSIEEWNKHLSIEGFLLTETNVQFDAFCKSASLERLVREFIKWIEFERRETKNLLISTGRGEKLILNEPILLKCRNDSSYIYTEMQLQLDYEKVLGILMGTELYDTPDVFLREVLQNAYDACKCRSDEFKKLNEAYIPNIKITYNSEKGELKIEDNGIGIDKLIFEKYVITIGKSFYKSKVFQSLDYKFSPISNFGIGIISCFMVSDTIEIESLKYYSAVEKATPIHYILNIDQKYIDERKGARNHYGTTITLKLKKDYIDKLKEKSIIDIIKENMTCQEIPINITIDGNVELLDQKTIVVNEEYRTIDNALIFELNNEPWLQGYLIIHQNHHSAVIDPSKISQQCFVISNKGGGGVPLTIPWLRFLKFFLNVMPPKKLNLKANRNKVHEDEDFLFLRNYLIEYMVNKFESEEYFEHLFKFIDDGRGYTLSGNIVEYKFLIRRIKFPYLTSLKTIQKKSFEKLIQSLKGQKIAVIHPEVLNAENVQRSAGFLLQKYKLVILHDYFIQYLYQFSQPYILYHDIIVTDISGLVFFEISFKKEFELNIKDYDLKYSWHREYEMSYKGQKNTIFCIVSNNQYNSFDIKINEKHKLGQLLKKMAKTSYSKRFLGSFKTNISVALQNKIQLTSYNNYDGEHHFFGDNNYTAFSLKTIQFMTKEFIESLNSSMATTLLHHLSLEGIIDKNEINDYFLTEKDFPSWWIAN